MTAIVAAAILLAGFAPAAPRPSSQPASAPATRSSGADWPLWGGSPSRNAVSSATDIPTEWDVATGQNIKWSAPLGTQTYGGPVVAGGRVYVGTNNGGQFRPGIEGDKGCLLCFREQTGELLWQATHDKLASGPANDWPEQGIASTPLVDNGRVYYVSNRCQLVCADANGFLDGRNDGPFTQEQYTDKGDADFIWILDLIKELGVFPHNLAACSPVSAGDLVFICTSNGVDEEHAQPPAPKAPSFIAVHKQTGEVVWKRNDPGEHILHGQWSSPAYGRVDGRPQVVFGGGDGWCYGLEPQTGEPLWKFDLNPKDSVWKPGGAGTKTSIVATPVIFGDRVYLGAGDDPESMLGPGHLYAIDATRRGDITETGRVWHVGGQEFGRTIASVAIADGLLYAADLAGFLSCFDAQTGQRYWRHDMQAAVWGSPCLVAGKVLLGTVDGELVVLAQGNTLRELARHDMRAPIYTTPAVANGTLFIATQKRLYAIAAAPATSRPAASQPTPATSWPMFRGNGQLTGIAGSDLPDPLRLRWRFSAAGPISSTAAIVAGTVYVGSEKDTLYALDLTTGQPRWTYQASGAIESSPTVTRELVVFGDDAGTLHACDARTGAPRWRFKTEGRIISSANVADDRLMFGSYDGALYCLLAETGEVLWKFQTEERVHGTPAVAGDHVLFAGCDARLHVVRLADGTPVREVKLGSVTGCSAAVSGTHTFLGTYGEKVLAIDWQTGQLAWQFVDRERAFPFLSSAAVTADLVIVGGRDKRLRAFDPQSGRQRWQFVSKGQIDSSPVIVGQRVFVGSGDGNLYAVALADGQELWRFESGGPIIASPAVGEGCLVIGNEDGVLYCFGDGPAKR